jgi:hypothetical protein
LGREPLLVLFATLTLAVCIGANTTVFSIGNSILVRPLPYPGSERIDWISERSGPNREDIGTVPDYYRLRQGNRVFEEVAAFNRINVNWTGVERPEQLDAAQVSASFFRVMGMRPGIGRYLGPEEEGSKAPAAIVLSYDFWRSRLGGDTNIAGKAMAVDRLPRKASTSRAAHKSGCPCRWTNLFMGRSCPRGRSSPPPSLPAVRLACPLKK